MKIYEYIASLNKRIRESRDAADRHALRTKLDYARAYAKGANALNRFRGNAIEREIGKTYTEGAQLAILFNKDIHPDEYEAYQLFRAECKAKVDADIATLTAELEAEVDV